MSEKDRNDVARGSGFYAGAFLAVFAAAWIGFGVVDVQMPDFGLDPSWKTVLGEALRLDLKFGTEIIYTGGPLSSLYTHYFTQGEFWPLLGAELFLVISFAGLVTASIYVSRRALLIAPWIIILLVLGDVRDPLFMAFPLLTALLTLGKKSEWWFRIAIAMGILATGLVTLAKVSVFPLAIGCFLLVDGDGLLKRRAPFHTIAYVTALFFLFWTTQAAERFWPFLIGSLDVSSGYTEAMFLIGSPIELATFLSAMAALLAAVILIEYRALRNRTSTIVHSMLRLGLVTAYLFMIWKAGFVRQDLHTLISWTGLGLVALAYATGRPVTAQPVSLDVIFALGAAMAVLLAVPWVWSTYAHESGLVYLNRIAQGIRRDVLNTAELLTNPTGQIAAWQTSKEAAWAKIRALQILPQLDGSVDIIPSTQSSLLAYGLDYQPRRSIQEFTTYTGRLIEANRRDLVERGPTYLLFEPGSIDGRHPASAEGPLWPDILRLYEATGQQGSLLVLHRRASPLGEVLKPPMTYHAHFEQDVPLPAGSAPVFLQATIRKTLFGRLMDFVFRPSLIVMRVTYMDGTEQRYRTVPAIIQAGIFVSPLIMHADDFLMVSTGVDELSLPKVKSIAFETSRMGMRMFDPDITITSRALDTETLRSAPLTSPTMRQLVEDRQRLTLLKSAAQGSNRVRLVPEGILAEAPTTITVPVEQASRHLTVGFGVSAGAYAQPAGTQGVCFRIIQQRDNAASHSLLDRCLTPLNHAQDRGEIISEAAADLRPGDRLSFETACLTTCNYGWAYWSRFSLDP